MNGNMVKEPMINNRYYRHGGGRTSRATSNRLHEEAKKRAEDFLKAQGKKSKFGENE